MIKIQYALELLDDGNWHSIDSLRRNVDLDDFEITELVTFLSDYDFVTLDLEGLKVKATTDFKKLAIQS